MNVNEKIITLADQIQDQLVAQRRDFHKYAEAGWLEMRTSSIIARRLTDLGYEVLTGEAVCKKDARMGVPDKDVLEAHYQQAIEQGADPEFVKATRGGMTGVIGILRCGEGPVVAMRFDIDALGVFEAQDSEHYPAKAGFASVNCGTMHACGHDGHATVGLGVATVLAQIKDSLHGTVKLIFQPAEEGVRGAKSIVENGHLDGVQYLIGSHVTGTNARTEGFDLYAGSYGSLATTKYDVIYHGKPAHAGTVPNKGNNALLAAATALLNLQAIPRHNGGATRINVGTLTGGSGRNVIADEAKMQIEVRGETTELSDYMSDYALRIIEHAAAMHGCTHEVKVMGAADSFESDPPLAERIAGICREKLGMKVMDPMLMRSTGSEDVGYMIHRVQEQGGQGTFLRILTPVAAPGHTRRYNFDEGFLKKSVKVFCASVYDIMK